MSETIAFYSLLLGRCSPDAGEVVACERAKALGLYRPDAIDALESLSQTHQDAYVKPQLFNGDAIRARTTEKRQSNPFASAIGSNAEVQTITCFALDVDANKPGYQPREKMLEALDAMPAKPTAIINSNGSAGGFHAYWMFAEPFTLRDESDRQLIAKLAKRWHERLQAIAGHAVDQTSDLARMLRLVGGKRSNGNTVSIEAMHPERLYRLDELALPPDPAKLVQTTAAAMRRTINAACGESSRPIERYIESTGLTVDSLLQSHGYETLGPHEWRRPGSQSGGKTFARATQGYIGANCFSPNAIGFEGCESGEFFGLAEMFVRLEFQGDWNSAATWCRYQLEQVKYEGVDLSEFLAK